MMLLHFLDRLFFQRISATGWGLMRITWATVTLAFLLMQWSDVAWYYSADGIAPPELWDSLFRNTYRFTILSFITDPTAVFALYLLLLAALALTIIGWHTRIVLTVSVLLLFSFHERNLMTLGGGDTVLRVLGFYLLVSPQVRALSLDNARAQWKHWKETGAFPEPLTMHAWPMRLLLWQYIIIYVTSAWDKMTGDMWLSGTAVAAALHHTDFARWPLPVMHLVGMTSSAAAYATLVFELSWLLLLVPREVTRLLPPLLERHAIRRGLLLGGVLFHGGIYVLMDVGSFSLAMTAGYAGLLLSDDFDDLRDRMNHRWNHRALRPGDEHPTILVLYDGICRLCRRSVFVLLLLDHLHRLRPVDFRNKTLHQQLAPDISFANLDRAMHIKLPPTSHKLPATSYPGFDAFRVLARHLPPLWPILPLLHLPGIAPLGRRVYARIAANRQRCAEGKCVHEPRK